MKNIIQNSALTIFSIAISLLALEVIARLSDNEYRLENFVALKRDLLQSAYPARYDPLLGWVPLPGAHNFNIWGKRSQSKMIQLDLMVEILRRAKQHLKSSPMEHPIPSVTKSMIQKHGQHY